MEQYERLVDGSGRIIIPWQIREKLKIKKHDALKIFERDGEIVLIAQENQEVK